ncbi:Hypothetical predicted protein [Olea europaea subsp. europaea]|uniref:Uncharacterized protein n=1 Tax=Olea europaea subsp. europaea TaxID=158383 RepID=A0A8S0PI12_OLEEU|nr:Hypothetical predicted protein [Olea europaea subsp. europaea]
MYNFFHGLSRPREIEIEWHVGRIAAATGPSVAVGAPGPNLGPGWSAKTKGHRGQILAQVGPPRPMGVGIEWHVGRNAAATEALVVVGVPRPDFGPVFSLKPRSGGIEMEWHVAPS